MAQSSGYVRLVVYGDHSTDTAPVSYTDTSTDTSTTASYPYYRSGWETTSDAVGSTAEAFERLSDAMLNLAEAFERLSDVMRNLAEAATVSITQWFDNVTQQLHVRQTSTDGFEHHFVIPQYEFVEHPGMHAGIAWRIIDDDVLERRMRERQVASVKAKELLLSCLDESQRWQLEAHDFFDVRSQSGRIFRIHSDWSLNITEIGAFGKTKGWYCIIRAGNEDVPLYDQMLMQKLMIEANEKEFLRTAKYKE